MKVGDLVDTPGGRGRVVDLRTDWDWVAGRSYPRGRVLVELPGGRRRSYSPGEVTPVPDTERRSA